MDPNYSLLLIYGLLVVVTMVVRAGLKSLKHSQEYNDTRTIFSSDHTLSRLKQMKSLWNRDVWPLYCFIIVFWYVPLSPASGTSHIRSYSHSGLHHIRHSTNIFKHLYPLASFVHAIGLHSNLLLPGRQDIKKKIHLIAHL